ncbi:MAG: sulfatase-like hydrolase/transferase [Puniceicoccaceae bacterium]
MKLSCYIPLLLIVFTCVYACASRPNIVWLVTEDNSVHYLKLYDPLGASMPNIERLARDGIVFNNAFSNAPVCSAARSTLITGCYAPRLYAQNHRREVAVKLPDGQHMFPWYLRQAGYYTSNKSKEDYNVEKGEGVWDESSGKASYRNRKQGQPFFHVQNFGTTHESRLLLTAEEMEKNPTRNISDSIHIFPLHPDTELFRYTNARYRDLHEDVDKEIGNFIAQLEEDGLMEDTIIFYYGDHGGVLPGSKGYIYERGVHVPLVVYCPEKWKHLMPTEKGNRLDGFVSFIDFGPTVLNLAGVEVPGFMDGKPFLGEEVTSKSLAGRNTAFSYADRMGEKYDLVRAIRVANFKYIRNYQPFNFDGLQNNYRYLMLAFTEWRDLYSKGKLSPESAQFFEPRPAECLYDLESDPFELNNLADDPAYKGVLHSMRNMLKQQVISMPDLGFVPEPELLKHAVDDPVAYGQLHKSEIAEMVRIADFSLSPFSGEKGRLRKALSSDNPHFRYWALIACSTFGEEADSLARLISRIAREDPNNLVRARAAEFLGLTRKQDPMPLLIDCLKRSQSPTEASLILNSITMLRDGPTGYDIELKKEWLPEEWLNNASVVKNRYAYLFGN